MTGHDPPDAANQSFPVPEFSDFPTCEDVQNIPMMGRSRDSFCYPSPFERISPSELAEMIKDPSSRGYEKAVILDARFDYEYKGGKIIGAKNVVSRSQIVDIFGKYRQLSVCIVVHCEFSSERGPKLLLAFRSYDRACNEYPNLSYPNIFLLEGGYKRFYEEMPSLCVGGYTPMREEKYVKNGSLKRSNSCYMKDILIHEKNKSHLWRERSRSQCRNSYTSFSSMTSSPSLTEIMGEFNEVPLSYSQDSC